MDENEEEEKTLFCNICVAEFPEERPLSEAVCDDCAKLTHFERNMLIGVMRIFGYTMDMNERLDQLFTVVHGAMCGCDDEPTHEASGIPDVNALTADEMRSLGLEDAEEKK